MKTKVIQLLGLAPDASEADILATVAQWAAERQRAETSAAFERRLAGLMQATNMPREIAIRCLAEQDAARNSSR